MNEMTLNFPLLLAGLVLGSGLIWLLDALFLAPGRKRLQSELRSQYPGWQEEGSKEAKQYRERVEDEVREPVIVDYARSFFPILLIVFVLRSFLFEPFKIPSESMVPTLEVGDYILVNKYTYGIRLPVLRTKVFDTNDPQRGDVMVFFPPHMKGTYFIKRVIGLPGDTVSYRGKQLFVNGQAVPVAASAEQPPKSERVWRGDEQLGSEPHRMQVDTDRRAREFTVEVKPGHYFMMGDNRDNSSDSRVWGQVPEQDIVGKAFAVWMHWESFLSIPSFHRVGGIK